MTVWLLGNPLSLSEGREAGKSNDLPGELGAQCLSGGFMWLWKLPLVNSQPLSVKNKVDDGKLNTAIVKHLLNF